MENYLGQGIPKLGFGLMRLPTLNGEIDVEQVKKMVDLFLAKGFRYFDTAYGYNYGKSERAIKEALVERYPRDRYLLATKLPAWAGANTREEAQQMFYTSLERTGAGYFDFYLLHNLGESRTHSFDRFGIWDFLSQKKQDGLIHHLGFSFHDKAAVLDKILTEHPEMEFVQLQINYADWDNPMIESKLCYEVARKHGKPVVIMEPVKGGILASPPPAVDRILKEANLNASLSSWAIRYAASLDGIITVLSGMSNLAQMEDNLSYMENFEPLSGKECEIINRAQLVLGTIPSIPCTSCAYCMAGCPQSIAIPGIFKSVNMINIYNNEQAAKGSYAWNTKANHLNGASACIACGQCESVCPQHIKIIDELKKAATVFE
jgi:Predicted oxidoreductases of the aldo/keto reductase family